MLTGYIALVRASPAAVSANRWGRADIVAVAPVIAVVCAGWLVMVVWPMRHDFTGFVVGWSVMSAAMMVPTILRPMQRIAAGRASRAVSFGSGYVVVWAALALPAWIVLSYWPINSLTLGLSWIAVGAYLQAPVVLSSFRTCRSLTIAQPPVVSGLRQGLACATGCWPFMVVAMMSVMAHTSGGLLSAAVMFAVMLVMMWQKSPARNEYALRSVGLVLVIAGAIFAVADIGALHTHIN